MLNYATDYTLSPAKLLNDPVYSSGMLREDWGFLQAYLLSDECSGFQGTADEARKLVFDYLRIAAGGDLQERAKENSEITLVLEGHMLHTEEFRDFRERFIGMFDYIPD